MRAKLDTKSMSAVAAQDMTLKEPKESATEFGFRDDRFSIFGGGPVRALQPAINDVWWRELEEQIKNLPVVHIEKQVVDVQLVDALRDLGLSPPKLD